jgi:hypothetical protein
MALPSAMNFLTPLAYVASFGNGNDLISLLIELVVAGVIMWLIIWFIGWVGLPEPFAKIVKVILGLVILIFLINILLGFTGHPVFGH